MKGKEKGKRTRTTLTPDLCKEIYNAYCYGEEPFNASHVARVYGICRESVDQAITIRLKDLSPYRRQEFAERRKKAKAAMKKKQTPKKRGRPSRLTPELCKEIYESYYGSSMNVTCVARLYKMSINTVNKALDKHAKARWEEEDRS